MKALNILSGIVIIGLLLITSQIAAQITVYNNTCHSMFVTASWGVVSGPCTPCVGCASSGVVAPGTGSIPGGPGAGGQILLNSTADINAGCYPSVQNAWILCSGAGQNGIVANCCLRYWKIVLYSDTTIVIEEL